MKSKTETITAALRALANDIQSPDEIPAICLREAADRLEELARERDIETKRADGHYDNYCEILKRIDRIANQRDEAWAKVERLNKEHEIAKRKLNDACVEMTQLKDAVPQ